MASKWAKRWCVFGVYMGAWALGPAPNPSLPPILAAGSKGWRDLLQNYLDLPAAESGPVTARLCAQRPSPGSAQQVLGNALRKMSEGFQSNPSELPLLAESRTHRQHMKWLPYDVERILALWNKKRHPCRSGNFLSQDPLYPPPRGG